jgi:hypothetical protein
MYRDVEGRPISRDEWVRTWEADRRQAETVLLDGKVVSTVWLGLDHASHGVPLIFETMVFPSREDFTDLDVARYSTRDEALAGHEAMVEKWTRAMVDARRR